MLFNSLAFLFFFIIVVSVYWFIKSNTGRNLLLLAASYFFYGWWNYRFLALLFLFTVVNYFVGLWLPVVSHRRKQLLTAGIIFNAGTLIIFKYFNFFSQSLIGFLTTLGFSISAYTLNLVLPLGISFFTFQATSYIIDVYKGEVPGCRNFLSFALFKSFFPQLVAGPIERAAHLMPQVERARSFDAKQAYEGLKFIILGYFLKCVVADNMAPFVNQVMAAPQMYSAPTLIFAAYCFAFQIYGDFAGYSYIAIGTAAMFGINLMTNFNSPYLALSVREFWKRWHISLTSWFSKYFYISLLGGNRCGKIRNIVNVLLTFVVSGFWHGANWTFIMWGFLNGVMYYFKPPFKSDRGLLKLFNAFICFNMICLTWVFFRAKSIDDGFVILKRIFTFSNGQNLLTEPFIYTPPETPSGVLLLIMLMLITFEYQQRNRCCIIDFGARSPAFMYFFGWAVLFILFFLGSFTNKPFIYFNF
ncbi:MAG: MBOAT family protein [Nitrospirae bacterium YQR-1]